MAPDGSMGVWAWLGDSESQVDTFKGEETFLHVWTQRGAVEIYLTMISVVLFGHILT